MRPRAAVWSRGPSRNARKRKHSKPPSGDRAGARSAIKPIMRNVIATLVLLLWLAVSALPQAQPQSSGQSIGYKSAADAEQKKTLLLKDFHPQSMLHAPVHQVDRAKFYVI